MKTASAIGADEDDAAFRAKLAVIARHKLRACLRMGVAAGVWA